MRYLDVDGLGRVSRVGLGTWQFGSREWGYGEDYASGRAAQIVARALELGITLFDTAEVYGLGRSERILGAALGEARWQVQVASKLMPLLPIAPVVRNRARGSARRLGIAKIPLYQVHQANPVVPDSVTMPGLRALLDDATIGAVGVSNYSLARWQAADTGLGRPVVSNQVQFSLAHAGPLDDLVPFARDSGRLVIAYSPLAQGLLGGGYGPGHKPGGIRALNPLFSDENLRRAEPLLDLLRQVAGAHGSTPAQIALAWLLSLPQVVVIPGASSVGQVESNAAAADIELTADQQRALTAAARAFSPESAAATAVAAVRGRVATLRSRTGS